MKSIWQNVDLPPTRQLPGNVRTDVLIIGGGLAGLLCAHQLGSAGVNCIVAEASEVGGGITKNTTAKITSQHGLIAHSLIKQFSPEVAKLYLNANEQAIAQYRKLCAKLDCDFQEQDNFIYSTTNRRILEEELFSLNALGFPAELTENLPLPFPTVGAVKFPNQAQFHPRKFLAGILPNLTVFSHTPVRELTKQGAVTDYGTISADKIIVATHFPFLNKHGSYFMKLYQQRSYVLALDGVPEFDGMYLDEQESGFSFRRHGNALLLGSGSHRTGSPSPGWSILEQNAAQWYPSAAITHRWATQDCISLDRIPYIGQYSKHTPNLYVATGFNKWGMTSSMVAAQILTDLILDIPNPYAPVFSPSRSMLHPQLGVNLLESTKNLLSFSPKRCPHMGCALKWNPQERSWDCPCHGSRFTSDGKLIDNPATGNLKKQE